MRSNTLLFYKLSTLFLLLTAFNTPSFASNNTVKFTAQEIQQLTGHYSTAYGYFHLKSSNGIISGYFPAKKAALKVPAEALRYE